MSTPPYKSERDLDSIIPTQAFAPFDVDTMPRGLPFASPFQATSESGTDTSDHTPFAFQMPTTSTNLTEGDFSPVMAGQSTVFDSSGMPHGLPLQTTSDGGFDTSDYTPVAFQMPTTSADLMGGFSPAMTGQATAFGSSDMPHGLPLPATDFNTSDYTHTSFLIPDPSSYQFQSSLDATSWDQTNAFDGVGVIPHGLPTQTSSDFSFDAYPSFAPASSHHQRQADLLSNTSDPAYDPSKPCHFFRLPQELLDMVFGYTYADDSPHKFTTLQTYYDKHTIFSIASTGFSSIKPFSGGHKVNDFLISKTFFLNAVRAWISAQKKWRGFCANDLLRCGLFLRFGTQINLPSPYMLPYLPEMRSVKVLRVHLSNGNLGNVSLHLVKLGEKDFEDLAVTKMVKDNLGGLKEIRIGPPANNLLENRSAAQQARVRANYKAYETYLQGLLATATMPARKPVGETMLAAKPLYLGSRVCVDSSEMLPEDFYENRGPLLGVEIAAKYSKDQEEHSTRSFQYGQIDYATVQGSMASTEIRKVESEAGDMRFLPSMKIPTMDNESKPLDMLLTDAAWIASEGDKLMVGSQDVGEDNSMLSKAAKAEIHISEKGDIASTKIEHATKKRNRQFEKPFGAEFEESEKDMDGKAAKLKATATATAKGGPLKTTPYEE